MHEAALARSEWFSLVPDTLSTLLRSTAILDPFLAGPQGEFDFHEDGGGNPLTRL